MKGFGTVITGTLIAGKVKKEEEVEIFPGRQRVRVRGVQVHGAASDQAIAGQRTALNLAGVQVGDLARGMTLTAPGLLEPTQRIEVQLSLLAYAKPLKTAPAFIYMPSLPRQLPRSNSMKALKSSREPRHLRNFAQKMRYCFSRVTGPSYGSTRRW